MLLLLAHYPLFSSKNAVEKQIEKYLTSAIKISKPANKSGVGKDSQPPSITEADKSADQVPKPVNQVPKPATEDPKPVVVPTDNPEVEKTPSGDEADEQSPMAVAFRAMKSGLKPTVTVETQLPIVPNGGGKFDPSIKDEEEKKEFFDSEEELTR